MQPTAATSPAVVRHPVRLTGQLDPTRSRRLWLIKFARGRHPVRLFDLIMGQNRRCYRVLAYAALMRDEQPPLHLDQRGDESRATP